MIDIRYKDMYDKFIEQYKNIHVNPWHEISERELEEIYNSLINSMDIKNNCTFKYFMDYIIKRLSGKSDAHTMYEIRFIIPMNFRIFDNEVIVNYPEYLKNSKLISINGISIDKILDELEEIIIYGTEGKRKYELEKALFNKMILFGLPSFRNSNELIMEIEKEDGEKVNKMFYKDERYSKDELFNYDEYRYGKIASYSFIDNCLIYKHSSLQQQFKEQIEQKLADLRKEDLSNIDTIIVDIRGNTGGNSAFNKLLMDFIKDNNDKKLICLTDYRVFSAGRYALRDLINLGAITIGGEISTPINCYGNNKWFPIGKHYFSVSECYFHPLAGWSVSSKEEFNEEATDELLKPYIFTPDILVEETKEDYMQGVDTILNFAIDYSRSNIRTR